MKTNLFIIIALSILLLLSATTNVRESNLKRIQPDKPISTITFCKKLEYDELTQVEKFIEKNTSNGYIVKTSSISMTNNRWCVALVILEKYDIHKWE